MTDEERKKLKDDIRDLCGTAILERMGDNPNAADISVALRWLDGLGRTA